MTTSDPLVTCIMPTRDRRSFVAQAIDYFRRQDYPRRELIIVDDGNDPVADLATADSRIRYVHLEYRATIGAKRNLACKAARGNIILHWDDDDWMADWRISYQATQHLRRQVDISGVESLFFYDLISEQGWKYAYRQNTNKIWVAGGSLCYLKSFWEVNPFLNINIGEDTQFIWSQRRKKINILSRFDFYIAFIHGNNVAPKRQDNYWHPYPATWLQRKIGRDWSFYSSLKSTIDLAELKTTTMKKVDRKIEKVTGTRFLTSVSNQKPLVTACLLSWKRPYNIQVIVDSLQKHNFIDEILVWNNNQSVELNLKGNRVRVINSPENFICYGRYLCASQARNNIIYFQDDDVLVENIPILFQAFLNDGDRVVHALSEHHYPQRERSVYPLGHNALLGWGSFINKDWLQFLEKFMNRNRKNKLFMREADKIFTLLLERRHTTLPAKIRQLSDYLTPGIALYRDNNHRLMEALAVREALAYIRKSKSITYPVTWNIVVTSYNYGQFLEEAVHSVLLNDADYVITIVDDASTDQTLNISNHLCKKYDHISYIRHKNNLGVGHARNIGIAAVDSLFVITLDADDKIGPDYLYEAEKLLRNGADIANPDAILFGNKSVRWEVPDYVTLPMLLKKNTVHCASAFRRADWGLILGVDENMDCWMDYDFWIRLAELGAQIRRIPGNHFYYRIHGHSKTDKFFNFRSELKSIIQNKHKKLYDVYAESL